MKQIFLFIGMSDFLFCLAETQRIAKSIFIFHGSENTALQLKPKNIKPTPFFILTKKVNFL